MYRLYAGSLGTGSRCRYNFRNALRWASGTGWIYCVAPANCVAPDEHCTPANWNSLGDRQAPANGVVPDECCAPANWNSLGGRQSPANGDYLADREAPVETLLNS